MKVYIINYYLKEEHSSCGCGEEHHDHEHNHDHALRDERPIIGEIKELGSWANLMPDCYLVKTDKSAVEITEKINTVMQAGDLIFVTEVTKDNCSSLTNGVTDWIRQ